MVEGTMVERQDEEWSRKWWNALLLAIRSEEANVFRKDRCIEVQETQGRPAHDQVDPGDAEKELVEGNEVHERQEAATMAAEEYELLRQHEEEDVQKTAGPYQQMVRASTGQNEEGDDQETERGDNLSQERPSTSEASAALIPPSQSRAWDDWAIAPELGESTTRHHKRRTVARVSPPRVPACMGQALHHVTIIISYYLHGSYYAADFFSGGRAYFCHANGLCMC